jgi:ABC-2 type transport system permease protein
VPFATPQVSAVVARELATWLRDPARGVELRTAWLTPLLMAAIIASTGWSWAVPLVGPAAAVFGAMAAINTYALDGTALWQLLTTPGALKADVRGRMAAWALLFGVPSVVLAVALQIATGSPVGQAAIGGAVAAAATGCATAPLLALLMPAVGADARDRVYPGQQAGDPTGGQMTVFPVTLLAAALPGVIGGPWWATALVAVVVAAAVLGVIPGLALRLLRQRGTALLGAMAAGDAALLRLSIRADAKM